MKLVGKLSVISQRYSRKRKLFSLMFFPSIIDAIKVCSARSNKNCSSSPCSKHAVLSSKKLRRLVALKCFFNLLWVFFEDEGRRYISFFFILSMICM